MLHRKKLPKYKNRLRLRGSTHVDGNRNAPSPGRADFILSRLGNASQLGLLALAVFGYFYTVLPVYQKSLLDEEIAKKTIELNRKEAELVAKGGELKAQSIKLAALNASVARSQQSLQKSQVKIGQLRGAVQSQYTELLPRLINEFQLLASNLCKLSSIPDEGFATCVREKVLPTANLGALRPSDRSFLAKLVDAESPAIHAAWREFVSTVERRRHEAHGKKNEATAKCEQLRSSDDYKDRIKKISIDHQCNIDSIKARTDLSRIDLDSLFSGEKFLSSALQDVARKFYATGASR